MTPLAMTGLIFGLMLVLMALRVPIAIAMFVAGAVGYVVAGGRMPLCSATSRARLRALLGYDLSVIPLFLLMGHVRDPGRLSQALFEFASVVHRALPRRPGDGRGARLRARSARSAARRSRRRRPSPRSRCRRCARYSYSGRLATGTLAAGGTLGILIPPSVRAGDLRDPDRAEHRQAVRRRVHPRHHRARSATCSRSRVYVRLASRPGAGAARAHTRRRAPALRCRRVADRRDLPDRLRRHLRRLVHADRRRRGRRGGDVRRRRSLQRELDLAGIRALLPRHRRDAPA